MLGRSGVVTEAWRQDSVAGGQCKSGPDISVRTPSGPDGIPTFQPRRNRRDEPPPPHAGPCRQAGGKRPSMHCMLAEIATHRERCREALGVLADHRAHRARPKMQCVQQQAINARGRICVISPRICAPSSGSIEHTDRRTGCAGGRPQCGSARSEGWREEPRCPPREIGSRP
jgi:hypothetical protein